MPAFRPARSVLSRLSLSCRHTPLQLSLMYVQIPMHPQAEGQEDLEVQPQTSSEKLLFASALKREGV